MSPLIASPAALDVVLALSQRPAGARLAELAEAAELSLSSAQTAVTVLLADRIVERESGRRPRYRLRQEQPALSPIVELAARYPEPTHVMDLLLRANPSVEFAARDNEGYLYVESVLAEPGELIALESLLKKVQEGREETLSLVRYEHDDLVDFLRDDETPRVRARAAKIIKGTIARSFPDRTRHGSFNARRLGRPHPSLRRVSQRALKALAREHGLRRIALFGSAVTADFRSDSDVDVLIEPKPDARLSLFDIAHIEHQLEALFDRDVDVLTPGGLRPEVRDRVQRQAVTLVG